MTDESKAEQHESVDDTPFDDDPPVDPSRAQVGNSKAKFFVPRDDEGEAEEGQGEGKSNE